MIIESDEDETGSPTQPKVIDLGNVMPETPPKSNNPFDDLADDKSPNQMANVV